MQDATVPFRAVSDIELALRALVPEIRQAAARDHRGHPGAALKRAAMHEAAELVRERLNDVFGPRDRAAERAAKVTPTT